MARVKRLLLRRCPIASLPVVRERDHLRLFVGDTVGFGVAQQPSRAVGMARHGAERGGYRLVPLASRVLVAQGGFGAGMAHSSHELSGTGTSRRSQRIAGVAEVMEMEVLHPHLHSCLIPGTLENRTPQGSSLRPPEQPAVRADLRVPSKMMEEFLHHEVRQADEATARIAFRWAHEVAAPLQLLELLDDQY